VADTDKIDIEPYDHSYKATKNLFRYTIFFNFEQTIDQSNVCYLIKKKYKIIEIY